MATGKFVIDEGTTTNIGTNTITEDAVTKHVGRSVLNNSAGTEIGTAANPLRVLQGGTGLVSNRKVVASAGTAVQLIVASTPCKLVIMSADLGNSNPVVIGDASVVAANGSQKGIVLTPGNPPFELEISDVNLLYVDAQTNGDAVTFAYLT